MTGQQQQHREPNRFENKLTRYFDDFLNDVGLSRNHGGVKLRGNDTNDKQSSWSPAIDIKENDREYVVIADVPGVAKEDLDVELHDTLLVISGQNKQDPHDTAYSQEIGVDKDNQQTGPQHRQQPTNVQQPTNAQQQTGVQQPSEPLQYQGRKDKQPEYQQDKPYQSSQPGEQQNYQKQDDRQQPNERYPQDDRYQQQQSNERHPQDDRYQQQQPNERYPQDDRYKQQQPDERRYQQPDERRYQQPDERRYQQPDERRYQQDDRYQQQQSDERRYQQDDRYQQQQPEEHTYQRIPKHHRQQTKGERVHIQERPYGYFSRTIQLPNNIKAEDDFYANLSNGVLKIRIPKSNDKPKKKITIS